MTSLKSLVHERQTSKQRKCSENTDHDFKHFLMINQAPFSCVKLENVEIYGNVMGF